MPVRALKQHSLLIALPAAIALVLVSCAKEKEAQEVGGGVKWLASYDEAVRLAESKDKPIMIDFYADWCGWCKRLDKDTYVDAAVESKAADFINLRIDADVEPGLASRFRIRGLPTILFIDPEGDEIHRVVGYRPPREFVDEMDAALRAFHGTKGT
jgi:thiol:disulfide interchange protein